MLERKRVTLEFWRGQPGLRFIFVSSHDGLVVGLCSNPQCPEECRERLGPDFAGGSLEVELEHRPPFGSRLTEFYLAHFVRRAVFEGPRSLYSAGSILAESDASGLTAVCYTDEQSGSSLLVDCGVPPGQNGRQHIDRLLAVPGLVGLVVTHGHMDHWNLCSGLEEMPVFFEDLTAAYVGRQAEQSIRHAERRGENQSTTTPFVGPKNRKIFVPGEIFEIGQFKVQSIPTAHSIPEASMFLIESPSGKRILHTGDFKFNGMDWRDKIMLELRLKKIGQQNIDVMHIDNLNAHSQGFTPEEGNAVRGVAEIIAHAQGRVVVATFASNLDRLGALATGVLDFGRPIMFAGSSMMFARELLFSRGEDLPVGGEPMEKTVIFATGCQAEEGSVLFREVMYSRPQIWLQGGDTVIFSSRVIPGNEIRIRNLVERLLRRGCTVFLHKGESDKLGLAHERLLEAFVHVSGHGQAEDIRLAMKIVQPKRVIPAVRNSPQIEAFRQIASEVGIEVLNPEDNHITI